MQTTLQTIRRPLRITSAAAIGMLAGAMALIKVVLVPFWRDAPPREFRSWFATYSGRIRGIMGPLGMAGLGTALATTAVEARTGGVPLPAAAAAAASAAVVGITVTVNEPANAMFVEPDFDDEQTTELLGRWARWHDARVSLGLAATAAAAIVATARR